MVASHVASRRINAFSTDGKTARSPDALAQRIATVLSRTGSPAHLHGLFVAGSAFYATRAVDVRTAKAEDHFHINFTASHPLAAFKWALLHDLARFPRIPPGWTPAIDQYRQEPEWNSCAPAPVA